MQNFDRSGTLTINYFPTRVWALDLKYSGIFLYSRFL